LITLKIKYKNVFFVSENVQGAVKVGFRSGFLPEHTDELWEWEPPEHLSLEGAYNDTQDSY